MRRNLFFCETENVLHLLVNLSTFTILTQFLHFAFLEQIHHLRFLKCNHILLSNPLIFLNLFLTFCSKSDLRHSASFPTIPAGCHH